jgi:hypothetical protein
MKIKDIINAIHKNKVIYEDNSTKLQYIISGVTKIHKAYSENLHSNMLVYKSELRTKNYDDEMYERYIKDTFQDIIAGVFIDIISYIKDNKIQIECRYHTTDGLCLLVIKDFLDMEVNTLLLISSDVTNKKSLGNISLDIIRYLVKSFDTVKQDDRHMETYRDCVIGITNIICSLCKKYNIDLEKHILLKLNYNKNKTIWEK